MGLLHRGSLLARLCVPRGALRASSAASWVVFGEPSPDRRLRVLACSFLVLESRLCGQKGLRRPFQGSFSLWHGGTAWKLRRWACAQLSGTLSGSLSKARFRSHPTSRRLIRGKQRRRGALGMLPQSFTARLVRRWPLLTLGLTLQGSVLSKLSALQRGSFGSRTEEIIHVHYAGRIRYDASPRVIPQVCMSRLTIRDIGPLLFRTCGIVGAVRISTVVI